MARGTASLEYSALQTNCFVTVSWPMSFSSPGNIKVLALKTENGKTHYVSVSSSTASQTRRSAGTLSSIIKISNKYAQALQLQDGERIIYWEVGNTDIGKEVVSASVSCCSHDDWEILESNADTVRSQLLHQLRVVYPGQTFPFWLSKSMVIHLKVDNITPAMEFGILRENSDIIIPSLSSTSKHTLSQKLQKHKHLRIHPLLIPHSANLLPTDVLLLSNKFHGFTYKAHFNLDAASETQHFLLVQIVSSGKTTESSSDSTLIKLFFLDDVDNKVFKALAPFSNIPSVYLHSDLLASAQFEQKSWVWMRAVPENSTFTFPSHCTVSRDANSFESHKSDFSGFKSTLSECLEFVKSSLSLSEKPVEQKLYGPEFGSLLIQGTSGSGKTTLAKEIVNSLACSPFFVHHEYVSCAKLRGKKPESIEKELVKSTRVLEEKQPSILILDDIDVLAPEPKSELSTQEEFLQYKLNETLLETLMRLKNQRIAVICTTRSNASLNAYWKSRPGFHIFQKHIKIPTTCKSERLEIFTAYLKRYLRMSGITDRSKQTVEKAVSNFTKDIKMAERDEHHKDASLTKPKTGALQDTSSSSSTSDASQTFHDLCCILGRDDQLTKQIELALSSVHEQNATPQFLVNVAKKWGAYLQQQYENYGPADIAVEHVSSSVGGDAACGINNIKTNEVVNERMKVFNEILQEEIRFSTDLNELGKSNHSIQQLNRVKISWNAIGGLAAVKEDLKKILEWPIKFPHFFKNAPVRLPCGILFYGYPGTGKTIVGLAIQDIVNVKFIHVKGPELLSKYIGASEQAVQDVFNRARESRPCILFFDEFDSLVPRRGHDSSGVSDRVVNQFLSEMDGVDGGLGEGVYLIAATSRPDLIDPAILRPGRLDKHLFFDLPSRSERNEIIKLLGSQMGLKVEHVSDWDEICTLTEGFTGADLSALMFTAQLSVVREHLSKLDNDEGALLKGQSASSHSSAAASTIPVQEIQVTKESVLSALKEFKPSIQGQEYRKFRAIYTAFMVSKSGKKDGAKELSSIVGTKVEEEADTDMEWRMQTGKRATLA